VKVLILILFVVFSVISCDTTQKEKPKEQKSQNQILNPGCYVYYKNGDTINMKIDQVGDSVTGTLDIAYAEKDANTGTFKAALKGDTLLGTYTFNSEGMQSEREIAFLIKNNQLIEGYGEMKENGMSFKDKNNLQYTSAMPLSKVACEQVN